MQATPKKAKCLCGWGPFVLGLVLALIFGWHIFPKIMTKELRQPIAFNHVVHVENAGMVCEDCHYLRDDGTFSGLPTTESCASCHAEAITDHPEEKRFIREYVDTGREIRKEWLVYQKQPDNVFFSHAAHSIDRCMTCHMEYETTADLCKVCHIDMSVVTDPPVYKENRLSGYSDDTMMMPTCESCHAHPDHYGITNASNACFVCHK